MKQRFFICKHCGNLIAMVKDTGVPVVCCGEKMHELIPGTTDASVEKHVPVYTVEGSTVHVKVGEAEHPMLPEHYMDLHPDEAGQPAQGAASRRKAGGVLRPVRGRRGGGGLCLLQPPQSLEKITAILKESPYI